jgi:hypothetical protein
MREKRYEINNAATSINPTNDESNYESSNANDYHSNEGGSKQYKTKTKPRATES